MDTLFNSVLSSTSTELTFETFLITMIVAIGLGVAISLTYIKTQRDINYQRNFAVTLLMLPIILSVIILFVGSNIARAFSLAGTLAIIRFRSAPGDPKDIGYIFFDMGAGLACGVGLFGYGILFVILLCGVMILTEFTRFGESKNPQRTLKITIPEDLNYEGAFDEIFDKYTIKHALTKIKTTDLGSLFVLVYSLALKKGVDEKEFINELRCRNGNLKIVLSLSSAELK
ncbi:MAG: DUF4956 domain-containing protein [Lachnospiraceae bacterium]|nr:DUF4956 domain-containing protein [Lachnospiraceae bacterium]